MKYIFFYQKSVHLGENTSLYCGRIIVVRVHATVFFLKLTQLIIIANGIKPGTIYQKALNLYLGNWYHTWYHAWLASTRQFQMLMSMSQGELGEQNLGYLQIF